MWKTLYGALDNLLNARFQSTGLISEIARQWEGAR